MEQWTVRLQNQFIIIIIKVCFESIDSGILKRPLLQNV